MFLVHDALSVRVCLVELNLPEVFLVVVDNICRAVAVNLVDKFVEYSVRIGIEEQHVVALVTLALNAIDFGNTPKTENFVESLLNHSGSSGVPCPADKQGRSRHDAKKNV